MERFSENFDDKVVTYLISSEEVWTVSEGSEGSPLEALQYSLVESPPYLCDRLKEAPLYL